MPNNTQIQGAHNIVIQDVKVDNSAHPGSSSILGKVTRSGIKFACEAI